MANGKKLVRSRNRVLAGVLGGIADFLDVDPTVVRVVYAVLTVFTAFSGVILYPILWLIIPEE
ncbi:MAG: PspC domain-containing protein [Prevotella sp.]|nr:PspC domain-containing protein [Prevotella sp.]